MNTKDTGGPAFPCHPEIVPHKERDFAGMTLRDYFMAHAPAEPQPWFIPEMPPEPDPGMFFDEHGAWVAEQYKQRYVQWPAVWADEMLKARDRGVGQSENDRRVAACLDALKHVSTEDLESGRMQSLAVRLADAEKQRNELLAALKVVTPYLRCALEYDCDVFGIVHNDAVDAESNASAAIAKATGEPQ